MPHAHTSTSLRHPRYARPRTIPTDPFALLGTPEICQLVGVTRETLYRWRVAGRMPPPDHVLPAGRVVWLRSTVEAWLRDMSTRATA